LSCFLMLLSLLTVQVAGLSFAKNSLPPVISPSCNCFRSSYHLSDVSQFI
jgi:hypothetical protein